MAKIAVYPGTFDPITLGHFDVIERALHLFDKVVIAVATSESKKPLFNLDKRVAMIQASVAHLDNVTVKPFNKLLVNFVKENGSNIIVRGLRNSSDFEYEIQLDYVNHSLNKDIETVYLMPYLEHTHISSSIVRTLLSFDSDVKKMIPKEILTMIKES